MDRIHMNEFPEIGIDEEIPEGFVDSSWHNDVSPSFEHEALDLKLWIDAEDPADREMPTPRYTLWQGITEDEPKVLAQSDDWADMIDAIETVRRQRVSQRPG